ncbi:MAG TPA: magnesium transporter CorA family protein [Pyrinomonadaceae bacterium]|nr:magnesium transporter CorA family protein [Pyrinomonadaceae bacterium]
MNDENPQIRAYLYDANGSDERIDLEEIDFASLGEDKLLWVNVLKREEETLRQVAARLNVQHLPISAILKESSRPKLDSFEDFFRFRVNSVLTAKGESPTKVPIDFVVGQNFIITVHEGEVGYFEEFRQRDKGETQFGELDAESFVATLVDLHIVSYFRALDEIEKRVDKLDANVLKKDIETDEFLASMVQLRADVSKLRRWLMPHRDVIYAFLRADFQQISESDSVEQYKLLAGHFENAVESIESSRETVLSVFDLYATKSAQLMNVFIQRLTFLTLVVGTLSVVAGILGMNYKVDFFESPSGFWITIAGMALIALGLTIFARYKRWI